MPLKCAGTRIDPPPSLPTPPADRPAAMAAASPPLDPPGVRSSAHGLLVRPYSALSVSHAISCSATLVTPRTMAPAARRRATSVASASPRTPARNREPVSKGMPATEMELLMLMGRRGEVPNAECRVPSEARPRPGASRRVRRPCIGQRALGVEADVGVRARVQRLDALQVRLDELDRGDLPVRTSRASSVAEANTGIDMRQSMC